MSSHTSLDAILGRLEQENAVELEFIKKFKEGLDVMADGMQDECHNRSEVLSEAKEKLERERARGRGHVTADQKAILTSIVKINILKCKSALTRNITDTEKMVDKHIENLGIARDRKDLALRKSDEEREGLNKLVDVVNGMRNAPATNVLRDVMRVWGQRQDLLYKEGLAVEKDHEAKVDMAIEWLNHVRCVHEEHIYVLKAIANAVGVEEEEIE